MSAADAEPFDEAPLAGVPAGLRARIRRELRTDRAGAMVEVRDRRGRRKLRSVWLYAPVTEPIAPSARELAFLLGAEERAWRTIVTVLGSGDGERAWWRACELVRGGAVEIECTVDGVSLGTPRRWRLTAGWERRRLQRATRRANERAAWIERADAAAPAIAGRYPQLSAALGSHRGPVERRVLVHAAEDLLAHRSHHGPRAFSQRHFGHTKARDDVERILARCGVEADALVELGIRRAGRTGLAGPVRLQTASGQLDFTGIKGPTDVRLDQPAVALSTSAETLIVIENRQAAETVSDRHPRHALFWTQGMMGPDSLGALAALAGQAGWVLAAPDADLGGVRIAEQILRVAPDAALVDVGAFPHEPRRPFPPGSASEVGLRTAVSGPAGRLACACLERGYGVEQELAAVDAITAALAGG